MPGIVFAMLFQYDFHCCFHRLVRRLFQCHFSLLFSLYLVSCQFSPECFTLILRYNFSLSSSFTIFRSMDFIPDIFFLAPQANSLVTSYLVRGGLQPLLRVLRYSASDSEVSQTVRGKGWEPRARGCAISRTPGDKHDAREPRSWGV